MKKGCFAISSRQAGWISRLGCLANRVHKNRLMRIGPSTWCQLKYPKMHASAINLSFSSLEDKTPGADNLRVFDLRKVNTVIEVSISSVCIRSNKDIVWKWFVEPILPFFWLKKVASIRKLYWTLFVKLFRVNLCLTQTQILFKSLIYKIYLIKAHNILINNLTFYLSILIKYCFCAK